MRKRTLRSALVALLIGVSVALGHVGVATADPPLAAATTAVPTRPIVPAPAGYAAAPAPLAAASPDFTDIQCGAGYRYATLQKGSNSYTGLKADIAYYPDAGISGGAFYHSLAGYVDVNNAGATIWLQGGVTQDSSTSGWYIYVETDSSGVINLGSVGANTFHTFWLHRSSTTSSTWTMAVDGVDRWSRNVPNSGSNVFNVSGESYLAQTGTCNYMDLAYRNMSHPYSTFTVANDYPYSERNVSTAGFDAFSP